jgi:DNA primase
MLSSNILIPKVLEEIGLEEFTNKDFQQIAEKIVELYHKNTVVKGEDVLHIVDDARLNKILMDIVTTEEFQNITDHSKMLESCMHFLKRRNNKKEIHQTKKKMSETAKINRSEEDVDSLLHEFHRKNKNIHALKNKT